MYSKIFTVVFFVGIAVAAEHTFSKYQFDYGKKYSSPKEFTMRKAIFDNNVKRIQEHNKMYEQGEVSYTMAVNQFTDMTQQEFEEYVQGLPPVPKDLKDVNQEVLKSLRAKYANYNFKDSFSWVDEGIVTSVKNQGQCGSCTAFAVTGSIESCFIKKSGEVIDDLAEQFFVDCAYGYEHDGYDAQGCSGAWPQPYFAYLYEQTGGQHQMESAYPYTAQDGTCKSTNDGFYMGGAVTDQIAIWGSNEDDLKMLLVEYGPVVTALDASYLSSYSGGVFHSMMCCNAATWGSICTNKNNHAVLAVGYGTEGGDDYWLVKNSWGKSFGEDGYFKIKRGTGHCGFGWQVNNIPLC